MEISREFSYCPQRKSWNKWSKPVFACMMAILGITAAAPAARSQQQQKEVSPPMELSRTVRPWEFLPITGTRAALFGRDRKSTRLNSSHTVISYAVFCLKKKKK